MAHPKRKEMVDSLLEKLGPVPVTWDASDGIWENRKRATISFNEEATHHLVLQDDSILCRDFLKELEKQIEQRPNHIISLYYGNRLRARELAENNFKNGGVEADWLWWGLAVVVPTKLIPDLIKYADNIDIPQDDTRMAMFIRNRGLKVWYPLPSLVDHRNVGSLIGDNGVRRIAFKFIGE
jgi:hypothetical protein